MNPINESTKYVLGFFKEENKYSVLPINWIKYCTKKGNFKCLWPNYRVTTMTIMRGINPSSKWTSHSVEIVEQFVSYEAAAAKELQLFIESGGESQSETEHENIEINNDSTSSDDEPFQILKKKKFDETTTTSNQLISNYNSDCVPEYSASSAFKTFFNLDTNSETDHVYNLPSVSNSTLVPTINELNTNGNIEFQNNALDNAVLDSCKMDKFMNATNMFLTRIDKKLDVIIDYIKKNPNSNIQLPSLDSTFLSYFPMKDVESLINMDELLKLDENITKLNNFINSIGGSDTKHYLKRVLPKLFSNKLATLCSWTGQKNNYRLVDHQIMKIMKKISYELYQSNENIFEMAVKDWFRHGAQRLKKEQMASDSSQKAQNH